MNKKGAAQTYELHEQNKQQEQKEQKEQNEQRELHELEPQQTADKLLTHIAHDALQSKKPYCAYVYDLELLRRHAESRVAALPSFCRLYYALKANSNDRIIRELAPIVYGFETASIGEIRKVRAQTPQARILFGGPVKADADLDEALLHGVQLIHVESRHELLRLAEVARRRGVVARVLLRVNVRGALPDATLLMAGAHSQFGIDERDIPDMLLLAARLPSVSVDGFHLHSLSNQLDERQHALLVGRYCELAVAWAETFRLKLRYLNAGGGIGVNYAELDSQFDWTRFTTLLQSDVYPKLPRNTELLFECGRYIAASCGRYAVEVMDVKRNHGRSFALVRGGTHHFRLPASWRHSHPFRIVPIERWPYPFPRPELGQCEVTIAGELCTPKDVLASDVYVDRLRVGDIVVFDYAGAYGWAISHHDFLSHPHPQLIFLP